MSEIRIVATGARSPIKRFAKAFERFAAQYPGRVGSQLLEAKGEDFVQQNTIYRNGSASLAEVVAFMGVPPNALPEWMDGVDVILDYIDSQQALRLRKENDPADDAGTTVKLSQPAPTLEFFSEWADTGNGIIPPREGLPKLFEMLSRSSLAEDKLLLLHAIALQRGQLPTWAPPKGAIVKMKKWASIEPEIPPGLWADGSWAFGGIVTGKSLQIEAYTAVAWIETLVRQHR